MCGYVCMCVCMCVCMRVEKCKAMLSSAIGSLAMVAVNITAALITSDYGNWKVYIELTVSAFFTSTEA